MSDSVPKLPEGRQQLEFMLGKLDEYISKGRRISDAREAERDRLLLHSSRVRRGLAERPWLSQKPLVHNIEPVPLLPMEVGRHLVFDEKECNELREQFRQSESAMEELIASGM